MTTHDTDVVNQAQPRLLKRNEAASALSIGTRSLDRLIASGELAVIRIGGSVRIAVEDIDALIEANREARR